MAAPSLGGRAGDTALIDAATGEERTYAALDERVQALAKQLSLRRRGLAFCRVDNSLEGVEIYLAARRAGLAVAPLDAHLPPPHLERLVAAYEPDWILTARGGLEARKVTAPLPHPDLGLLLGTSGTTGSPKWIRHGHLGVAHNASAIRQALGLERSQRAFLCLPFHLAFGLSVLHSHLEAGSTVVLSREGPASPGFWRALHATGAQMLYCVPYMAQVVLRLGLERAPGVRVVLVAGGRLAVADAARIEAALAPRQGALVVMYGQSEAVARIAILPPAMRREKPGGVGLALAGGQLAVEGEEIIYRGPNVMWGYAERRADLARGDELAGTLRTGDLGYVDRDGVLFVTGRKKRIAKLFGLRISLDEVEALMAAYAPAAAVAAGDEVVVHLEGAAGEQLPGWQRELGRALGLPPRALCLRGIEQLPRNKNGKVDYLRLQGGAP